MHCANLLPSVVSMRRFTSMSCARHGQALSSMTKFWRWRSGGPAVKEEFQLGGKESEIELKDYDIPISEASQSPSRQTHRRLLGAHTTANTSSGDQLTESGQPLHQRLPSQSGMPSQHAPSFRIRRDWQHAFHSTLSPPQESFVFTSFNILASKHAFTHRNLYPTIPIPRLAWDSRRIKVLANLVSCRSDVICLQEVDNFKDLEEDLASRGYVGLYKARTGEMPDGCAIFWKNERFQLLQERSFEFSMLGMRDNVAQLCVLQLTVPGLINNKNYSSLLRREGQVQSYRLVVGNIHVLFNPKRGDIKLGQCRAFLEQVHHMSNIWHGAPVVIGGDFNSTPSSAVYKYLATSELDLSNLDRRYLSGLIPEVPNLNRSRKEDLFQEKLKEISTAEVALQQMGSPPGKTSMEHADVVNQTNLYVSLGSHSKDMNGLSSTLEQSLELTEQTLEHRTSMAAVFRGATESVDKIIECTVKCVELESSVHAQTFSDRSSSFTEEPSKYVCSDYGWGAEEFRIATGNSDCTMMQHGLKLYSAYSDIKGHNDTRDKRGEPLVTTCHRDFLGTVDYIWRNDGLKTTRVLDTLSLKAFAKDKGLPIKIWGSDHLPLVCELAFV